MPLHCAHSLGLAALALCGCGLCHRAAAGVDADPPALESVNVGVNHRIVFEDDLSNWGVADYWATPAELFARGSGDCEDFAIAKFFALLAAGVPAKQVRLVYAELLSSRVGGHWQRHIVVAYLPSDSGAGDERILDNLLDEIRPLSRRPDLHVLMSFDVEGVWAGLERGPPARDAERIRPWAQVLKRMATPADVRLSVAHH